MQLLGTFLIFSMAWDAAGSIVFPTWRLVTLEEVVMGMQTFVACSPAFLPAQGVDLASLSLPSAKVFSHAVIAVGLTRNTC